MMGSSDGCTGTSGGVGGCAESGRDREGNGGVCSADGCVGGCMDGCVFCMIGGADEVTRGVTKGGEFAEGRFINPGRKFECKGTGCCREGVVV